MHPRSSDPARRRRYLAAMGIDVYVARDRAAEPAVEAAEPQAQGTAAADLAPPAASPAVPHADVSAPSAGSGLEDARALLDERTSAPAPESPARETAPTAEPERAAEPAPIEAAEAAVENEPTPRFRLQALRCGLGLLLVDEAALPEARRETLLRLGDLLRGGLAVRGADLSDRMETQAFFWPQVDAPHVDQSRPRAEEALTAWVRRCTNDGEGFLVLVEGMSPSAAPLGALEALPVRRARVSAAFLEGADATVHRAAWRALDVLAVTGP